MGVRESLNVLDLASRFDQETLTYKSEVRPQGESSASSPSDIREGGDGKMSPEEAALERERAIQKEKVSVWYTSFHRHLAGLEESFADETAHQSEIGEGMAAMQLGDSEPAV